jgi:hypothetical protein
MSDKPLQGWLQGVPTSSSQRQQQLFPAYGANVEQNNRSLEDAYSVHLRLCDFGVGGGITGAVVVAPGAPGAVAGDAAAPDGHAPRTSSSSDGVEDTLSWFGELHASPRTPCSTVRCNCRGR